jgi:iron-sulfur cluster assembly protein
LVILKQNSEKLTTSKDLPFELSEAARAEVKSIFKTKNIPENYGLRVGIKGGGCSGISYLFGFDTKHPTDEAFEMEEIPVFIEKKHFMYVSGLKIDFEDGPHARGFTFENPDTKF